MATATFTTNSRASIVMRIKSEAVFAAFGNVIDKPLTFTEDVYSLKTTNSKANNNVLYAIVGAGTSLGTLVEIYHHASQGRIGYFTVQGGNVGVNDFIYHIRQITLSFV